MNSNFKAGAGREIVTPYIGSHLFGYRPDVIAESVNDNLTVTVAAFEENGVRALVICATICEISTALANEIRNTISDASGIPFDYISISATHTHSGPVTVEMAGWGDIDRVYCDEILIPKTLAAAKTAISNLIPAKLGIGDTISKVGINRRETLADGTVILGQNPWGIYDPQMTVIALRGLDGSPILNIIHYGCHGTAAGCNHEISRDWSGVMIDRLEEMSSCMTVFINGACGDVGPRLTNGKTVGDISYVRELGAVAASDALRAYNSIKEFREDISLKTTSEEISLPYKPLPSIDENAAALAQYDSVDTSSLINIEKLEYEHLLSINKELKKEGQHKTAFTYRQTLIAVGPVLFVPLPFEVFSEITIRLRHYSKYPYTLSLSNSNGANAYLPSQDQICRGGYEIRTFTAGGVYCLCDNTDDNIITANLNMINTKL